MERNKRKSVMVLKFKDISPNFAKKKRKSRLVDSFSMSEGEEDKKIIPNNNQPTNENKIFFFESEGEF